MSKIRLLFGLLAVALGLLVVPSMASALSYRPAPDSPLSSVGQSYTVATGDFNGDGYDDIATSGTNTSGDTGVDIRFGNADGTFTAGNSIATDANVYAVNAGDFNNDGRTDLFVSLYGSLNSRVYLGNADGSFSQSATITIQSSGGGPKGVTIGDADGDGNQDIIITGSSARYFVDYGNGNGNFTYDDVESGDYLQVPGAPSTGDDIFQASALGDFNGDGDPDLALALVPRTGSPASENAIYELFGSGGRSFTTTGANNPHLLGTPVGQIESLAAGDFNGDGIDDLAASSLVYNTNDGSIQTWLGSDGGSLQFNNSGGAQFNSDQQPGTVVSGDFNGDGDADLAFTQFESGPDPGTHNVVVLDGAGDGTFAQDQNSPFELNASQIQPEDLAIGDFNGDGALDFASNGSSVHDEYLPVLLNSSDAAADPSSIDFGFAKVGDTTSPDPISFVNSGVAGAKLSNFSVTGDNAADFFFVPSADPCTSNAGSPCTGSVYFTPSGTGLETATLSASVADGPDLTVPLSGTGAEPGGTFDSTPLDFGDVPTGAIGSKTVTLTATGDVPLEVGAVSIAGTDPSRFSITQNDCSNSTLSPGDTCTEKLTFSPNATGQVSATLEVPNDGTGDQSVPLSGNGTDAGITPSDTSYDFGTLPAGSPTGNGNYFTFTSSGTTALDITGYSITGPNAADFSLSSFDDCLGGDLAPPDGNCDALAIFKPGLSGGTSRTATLTINSNASSGPLDIPLSGTASGGALTLNPVSFDFGDVKVGQPSATKTIAVTSSGTSPVAIDNVSVNGPDRVDFDLVSNTCDSTTLPVGGTCQVVVKITPSERGVRHGEMKFSTDSGNFYDELSGNGIDPVGSLSPSSQNFGSLTVGSTSAAKTISLTSTGQDPLKVTSASVTGTDAGSFKLANAAGCNGTQATTCNLSVTFAPIGSAGARSAKLSVVTNAGTLSSTLTGTATTPVTPTTKASLALKAGKKVKAGRKLSVTTTVKNTGNTTLKNIVLKTAVTKKLAKTPKKVKISSLAPGKSVKKAIKVATKKSAKKGKKLTVTVMATAGGKKLASKKLKSTIKK